MLNERSRAKSYAWSLTMIKPWGMQSNAFDRYAVSNAA